MDSVPLIGADKAWSAGDTGKGMTVAIVDSGVDKKHPFLSGKVVSEACYSTTDTVNGYKSLCPGGVQSSIAQGSGVNCSASVDGCEHGTHVAGIAAGSGSGFSGVAKGASIIAIQVFSSLNQKVICDSFGLPTPCALSWTTDQVGALERVLALRNTYKIASVNISIGGGKKYISQSECDLAPQNTAMKAAIDNLRSVGIATVISSGNANFTNGLAAPGCISSAISVGATTKADAVDTRYSNSANFLSLLAPGTAINSSIPGGLFDKFNGTSMAAPHVTGAWAILKQAKPTASVSEILDALTKTGVPIRDPRNGITKPRIQVDAALQQLVGSSGADAPTQISPSDQFTTGPNPPYVWTAVKGATGYLIWINNTDTTGKLLPGRVDQYMPIDQVWCSKGQCAMKGKVALVPGTADWWISAFFADGHKTVVGSQHFTVQTELAQISPADQAKTGTNPTYTWTPVKGAAGYLIWVNNRNSSGTLIPGLVDQYMTAQEVGCSKDQCSAKGKVALLAGSAEWWISAYAADGRKTVVGSHIFTVQ